MDDTSLEVYRLQVRIWQAKSFQERMRLGCAADKLGMQAAASLIARTSNSDPAALFIQLHGASFSPSESERIAQAIRTYHSVSIAS